MTLGEDAGRAHVGNKAHALAALRNAVLTLFHVHQWTSIADAASAARALALIGVAPPPTLT